MKNPKLEQWCQTAAASIRYMPDREAVEAELLAHMEDKYDALREQGIPENELEDAVLRSMGSAEEIAPQLAAIHKPFWGYVESVTRYLAFVLAVTSLLFGYYYVFSFGLPWPEDAPSDAFAVMSEQNPAALDIEPNVVAKSDGYTYTATRAAIWSIFEGYNECIIRVEVTGGLPLEYRPEAIKWFWAVDDLGTYYYSDNESPRSADHRLQVFTPDSGIFRDTYHIMFRGFASLDAKWVELHYDRDGRDIVLHIDLTGGDAA